MTFEQMRERVEKEMPEKNISAEYCDVYGIYILRAIFYAEENQPPVVVSSEGQKSWGAALFELKLRLGEFYKNRRVENECA